MLLFSLLFFQIKALNGIQCQCSELTLESECLYAGCEWIINQSTNTFQCIDKSPIHQPNCQNYADQLVCNFLQGCAWNNLGKCEQFTQCSDYVIDQYDTSDQCYLKDYTCVNGQINESGLTPCQSINEFCNNQVNFITSNNLLLQTNNQPSYNQVQNCISQQNSFYQCSMIKNEIFCKFVKQNDETIICEWQNEKCIQVINPQLNSLQCYLKTGGTYSWQENKCKKCQSHENNKRILMETINTPTFTQYSNITKQITSYELITNPNYSQAINCTNQVIINSTYICFTQDCNEKKAETYKTICQTYSGINLDNLENESTTLNHCSSNQNSTILSNGYNYTQYNLITECFSTTSTFIYSNGLKKGIQISSMELKTICQKTEIMSSLTKGNSVQKCEQIINSTKGLNTEYIEKCNSVIQEEITPDNIDTSQPFLNITKTDLCNRLYEQNISIDIGIITLSQSTLYSGEEIKNQTLIQLDTKMLSVNCKSNFSSDYQITNETDEFQNITTIKNYIENCKSEQNNDETLQIMSHKIINETQSEQRIIIQNETLYNASLVLKGTILIIGNVEIIGTVLMNKNQLEDNTIIESGTVYEYVKILINGTITINGVVIVNGDVLMNGNEIYNQTVSIIGNLDLVGRIGINEIDNDNNDDIVIDICPTGTIFDGINCNPIDNSDPPNQIQFNITMNDQTQNQCDNNSQCQ